MTRIRIPVLLSLVAIFVLTSPASALVVGFDFQNPIALAFDAPGHLFVLDNQGSIAKIALTPQPMLLGRFGAVGSGNGQFKSPEDIVLAQDGNLVVADSGNARLVVFSTTGAFVRNVACAETPQRIVVGSDGTLYVLEYLSAGLAVERFSPSYQSLGTFDVSAACGPRTDPSYTAAMTMDANGKLWVADHVGCGENYVLRRYNADGSAAGSWFRAAGELSSDTLAAKGYNVGLIADVFSSADKLYVILGTGGAETGGLNVDVWSTGGTFQRRSAMVGPARPMVRGLVRDGLVWVPDALGNRTVLTVPVAGL